MTDDLATTALEDLSALVSYGPRFHGTAGIADAANWIVSVLGEHGLEATRQTVALPGWHPGYTVRVAVRAPIERELPAWPMLWSAGTNGPISGQVHELGPEGIWGDSIVWQRFVVRDGDRPIAYLHARDGGPAAPQPLPAGSDASAPHFAIGHLDGMQLAEWLADSKVITVDLELDSGARDTSVADNLVVDIAGTGEGLAIVCAHYDTFYNTVGAYDNGSGTVALLALARQWAEQKPARDIRLVFFTAEEWHLGGSRHYVASLDAAERDQIDFVLNLDGLGRGDILEAFAGPEAFGVTFHDAVLAHAAATGRSLRLLSRFPPTKGTDDASFHAAGIPSAFVTFNDLIRLHQPDDQPNEGIAANVAWTVPLARIVAESTSRPERADQPGLL
jgi:hypothetical protein